MTQIDRVVALADKLAKLDKMRNLDASGEPLSWTTSLNLIEAIDSFIIINDRILNKIEKTDDISVIEDAIHEIGEELRHAIYHIDLLKYFSYIR